MKLAIVEDEKIYVEKIKSYLERYQNEFGYEICSVWLCALRRTSLMDESS